MRTNGLSDIDSLTLFVRDKESQRLISEAVTAYRGGAYRSAIVATWIAVTYDIIAKAQELAAKGEGDAKAFVGEIDAAIAKAHTSKDFKETQAIERDLLKTAMDRLQILASHEYIDLDRLREDRNHCAHPAFIADGGLFQPSPELVRSHLVHALQHLLINAPLQGKAALSRLEADILSLSYPTNTTEIGQYISDKYLSRAKDTLVRNIIKRLITLPFSADGHKFDGQEWLLALTLNAVSLAKPAIYDDYIPALINPGLDGVSDSLLLGIGRFIEADPRIWEWLSDNVKLRLKNLLVKATIEDLKTFDAIEIRTIPELSEIIVSRFNSFDIPTQTSIIASHPRPEFADTAIEIYSKAGGYRYAEILGQTLITRLASCFQPLHIEALLKAVADNGQIWGASGTPKVLEVVFDETHSLLPDTKVHWEKFLAVMLKNAENDPLAHYAYPSLRNRLAI